MNPVLLRAVLLSPSIDADAKAWRGAVAANGGSVSRATLRAVSTFCKSAKASGYWTKLNRINLFCGDQLAAALVPLKVGGGNATDTNVNFVAGDYTEATGLTGNGTTKYLQTGLTASVSLSWNDWHLGVYNRTSGATGGGDALGARNGASGRMDLLAPNSDGTAYVLSDDTLSASAAITGAAGLVVGSRITSTDLTLYRNGSQIAQNVTANAAAIPPLEVYVFCRNDAGAAGVYSSHSFAMYSIGSGLTAADVTAYNTHIQTFQQALGRSV